MNPRVRSSTIALLLGLGAAFGGARAQEATPAEMPAAEAAAPEAAAAPVESPPARVYATTPVVLHTNLGDIRVALESERAPATTRNFLHYVDTKRFDGTTIYRAAKVGDEGLYGLVQGGLQGDRKRAYPPVVHESPGVTGVSNTDGAISMARSEPGSASGDFFFVLGNLVALDGNGTDDPGYAAFGHVVDGMEILKTILGLPRTENAANPAMKGQMLAQPVKIVSVRRD